MWTEEGVCIVLNSTVTADMNCSYNCGSDCWRVSKYPCLQVYVSVNNTGRVSRLSHNEETQDTSSEVSTVPEGKILRITEPFQMLTKAVRCWPDYKCTLFSVQKMLVNRIWHISWSSWKMTHEGWCKILQNKRNFTWRQQNKKYDQLSAL